MIKVQFSLVDLFLMEFSNCEIQELWQAMFW